MLARDISNFMSKAEQATSSRPLHQKCRTVNESHIVKYQTSPAEPEVIVCIVLFLV